MDIYIEVEKLMEYSVRNGFVEEEDRILVTNSVLEYIGLDSYREFSGEERESIKNEINEIEYPCRILDNIIEWAEKEGKLVSDTLTYKDLLNSGIMGRVVPRTSEVRRKFWDKYENRGAEEATHYFYDLSKKSNYIRTDRLSKNIHWTYESGYGDLEITVNLSKPEKDPREIALARNSVSAGNYPKGLLSKENEGYMGRLDHPGRQNHRIVKFELTGEEWYFQYSPYTYYNEHSIIFSGVERPMKIDRQTFRRLLEFVEKFPHYFIGSNADLPIVGGSILSHDHFQAGKHEFPMEKAKLREKVVFEGYEDVEAGIVEWPMSVIRLRGEKERIVEISDRILEEWTGYNAEKLNIYSYTKGERHNTVTPIARFKKGKYEMDLVLRNNLTNSVHPLGIFHPHEKHHNIKKENIGLIEVMGLAILPGRLKKEMEKIKELIVSPMKGKELKESVDYKLLYTAMEKDGELKKHKKWLEYHIENGKLLNTEGRNVEKFLRNAIGKTFSEVLEDCGVFKNDQHGRKGFRKFIEKVNSRL